MKTLADLKRDAKSGNMSMEMLEWYGKTGEDIKLILRGIRKVEGANSVALLLRNNEGNTSELRIKYCCLRRRQQVAFRYGRMKRILSRTNLI